MCSKGLASKGRKGRVEVVLKCLKEGQIGSYLKINREENYCLGMKRGIGLMKCRRECRRKPKLEHFQDVRTSKKSCVNVKFRCTKHSIFRPDP